MFWIPVIIFIILLFPCIESSDDVFAGFAVSALIALMVFLVCFISGILWFDDNKVEVVGTQNTEIVCLDKVYPEVYDEDQYVIFDGNQYIFYINTNGFLEKQTFEVDEIESIKYSTDNKAIMFIEKLQLKSDFARWFFMDGIVEDTRITLIIPKDSEIKYIISEDPINIDLQ